MRLRTKKAIGMFIISEHNDQRLKDIAHRYFKVSYWKEDVWPEVKQLYPFEICGQIDFETGHLLTQQTNGVYFGEPDSSSDAFIYARRKRRKLPTCKVLGWSLCRGGKATLERI